MSVDRFADKYPGMTPYQYGANNPLGYTDPTGDTLRAVNQLSGTRALGLIQNSFNSASIASSMFSLADDGVTFNFISSDNMSKAMGSLSSDEQTLFQGYAAAINGSETNVVEVVKRGENLSKYGQDALGISTANALDSRYGGGYTTGASQDGQIVKIGNEGNYSAVVMNATNPVFYSNGKRPSLPGEILAHELLGHGLGDRNAISGSGYDASIQMGNTYLRAKGFNYFRKNNKPGRHSRSFLSSPFAAHDIPSI